MAYRLAMLVELSRIHKVFYVFTLRTYIFDSFHVLEISAVKVKDDLSYEEQPVEIFD